MERVVARRWTMASVLVAGIVVLMMAVASLTPGIALGGGSSDASGISSPARDIAAAQHTDVNLGEKVTQIYLISVLGILIIAVLSFVVLAIISLRDRRKEKET